MFGRLATPICKRRRFLRFDMRCFLFFLHLALGILGAEGSLSGLALDKQKYDIKQFKFTNVLL